jgi:hypothetical protein
VEDEGRERQLNIHLDPDNLAGVYANFANVSFSDYEFTVTFARIDHEVEEGDVPGVVVTRVNMAPRFMRELIDAMNDSWSESGTCPRPILKGLGHRDPLHRARMRREREREPAGRRGVGQPGEDELPLELDERGGIGRGS